MQVIAQVFAVDAGAGRCINMRSAFAGALMNFPQHELPNDIANIFTRLANNIR
jgi:hypothetical protein